MVTIDQKIIVFDNLIQHDISEKFKNNKCNKEEYYEKLQVESKNETDKIVYEMELEEKERLDRIYLKEEASIKKIYKSEFINAKEHLLNVVLEKIDNELVKFTKTEKYKQFIDSIVTELIKELEPVNSINIHITDYDMKNYGEYIKEEIYRNYKNMKINSEDTKLEVTLVKEKNNMIGGIIAKTTDQGARYDFSLKRKQECSMPHILRRLNSIIEEGDRGE